jgi:hypothetical protein
MRYVIVSVYDRAVSAYARPVFVASEGSALRSFDDEVNRKSEDNEIGKHPADYNLSVLGSFDDSIGVLTSHDPRVLVEAVNLLK